MISDRQARNRVPRTFHQERISDKHSVPGGVGPLSMLEVLHQYLPVFFPHFPEPSTV